MPPIALQIQGSPSLLSMRGALIDNAAQKVSPDAASLETGDRFRAMLQAADSGDSSGVKVSGLSSPTTPLWNSPLASSFKAGGIVGPPASGQAASPLIKASNPHVPVATRGRARMADTANASAAGSASEATRPAMIQPRASLHAVPPKAAPASVAQQAETGSGIAALMNGAASGPARSPASDRSGKITNASNSRAPAGSPRTNQSHSATASSCGHSVPLAQISQDAATLAMSAQITPTNTMAVAHTHGRTPSPPAQVASHGAVLHAGVMPAAAGNATEPSAPSTPTASADTARHHDTPPLAKEGDGRIPFSMADTTTATPATIQIAVHGHQRADAEQYPGGMSTTPTQPEMAPIPTNLIPIPPESAIIRASPPPGSSDNSTQLATGQVGPAMISLASRTDGSNEMNISLHPRDMGEVQIRLTRGSDGSTAITVTATEPGTLQQLTQNAHHLHAALDAASVPTDNRTITFQAAIGSGADRDQSQNPPTSGDGGAMQDGSRKTPAETGSEQGSGQQRSSQQGQNGQLSTGTPDKSAPSGNPSPIVSRRRWQFGGLNITA